LSYRPSGKPRWLHDGDTGTTVITQLHFRFSSHLNVLKLVRKVSATIAPTRSHGHAHAHSISPLIRTPPPRTFRRPPHRTPFALCRPSCARSPLSVYLFVNLY
jgi:hypothetical protein